MDHTIPVASPHLDEDDITAAVRVLRSGALVQGGKVAAFEDEFPVSSTAGTASPPTPAPP